MNRRTASSILAVCTSALLLAGCEAAAPTAGPVGTAVATGGAAGTPSSAGSQAPAAPSIPTIQPTSDPPEATATKTPGQCFDSGSLGHPRVTSGTTTKPYGERQSFADSGENVSISVSKGTVATEDADSFGGVSEGDQLVVFDVDAALTGGSLSLVSYTQFTLWDPQGHSCRSDIFSSAVHSSDRLSLKMLSKSEPKTKGKIVFEVPADQDYSQYTLSWSSVSSSDHAALAWKG